jgi:casein kinase II subunit beta
MLVPVPEDFFTDFNMYGISKMVANFDEAISLVNNEEDADVDFEDSAQKVYSLVHQRFLLTPQGLQLMKQKILKGDIGWCPRVLCERQPVIPFGSSSKNGVD